MTAPPPLHRRRFLRHASVASVVLCAARARGDRPDAVAPATTPATTPDWIEHTVVPANREVPVDRLVASWLTPVERFYVRSHAAAPTIDAANYRLQIGGLVRRPASMSLSDLQSTFAAVTVTATMTCAGNRRTEHSRTRQIAGVPWGPGAIGNATWTGYRLSDVLKHVGATDDATDVWFDGVDKIDHEGGVIGFGASIPIAKAVSDSDAASESGAGGAGAILCTHMNGQPLTLDHGYPLRTVVPGYIGARSVKWLGSIRVSDRPNPNHYQSTAYKVVTETHPLDWAETAPIYRFAINAVIAAVDRDIDSAAVMVKGYALPPGQPDATIARVDLSTDDGATWTAAELVGPSQPLCWQLWQIELTIPDDAKSLLVRAIDNHGEMQPRQTPWNKKGYMYNAQHRIDL